MVIRLKVPIEMHYTVIPMGTSKVNSSLKRILYETSAAVAATHYWQICKGRAKLD